MSKGWVYILSNPSMPGLVKIGKTTRSVERRMDELYQSGVPQEFTLQHSAFLPDCDSAEREMHDEFNDLRLNAGREFFRCDQEVLRSMAGTLNKILEGQVNDMVEEFMPGYVVKNPKLIIDEIDLLHISSDTGFTPEEVSSAFSLIDKSAINAACHEWRSKRMTISRLPLISGGAFE